MTSVRSFGAAGSEGSSELQSSIDLPPKMIDASERLKIGVLMRQLPRRKESGCLENGSAYEATRNNSLAVLLGS